MGRTGGRLVALSLSFCTAPLPNAHTGHPSKITGMRPLRTQKNPPKRVIEDSTISVAKIEAGLPVNFLSDMLFVFLTGGRHESNTSDLTDLSAEGLHANLG